MEAELGSVREGLRNENGGGRAGGGARRLGLGVGVARRETDARPGSLVLRFSSDEVFPV